MANDILQVDFMERARRGAENGRARRFADIASQAYATEDQPTRNALLTQAIGLNPQGGRVLRQEFREEEDADLKKAIGAARYMKQALDGNDPAQIEGSYQAVRPFLTRLGAAQGKVPPEKWSDEMRPSIHQILAMGGAEKVSPTAQMQNFDFMTKGFTPEERAKAARIDAGLEARAGFTVVPTAEGYAMVDKQSRAAQPLNYGAAATSGSGTAPGSFGIAETDDYVRKIMSNIPPIPAGSTPEQVASLVLPHLVQQESAGNPNAVSAKGARGLAQVMPETGRNPGFGVTPLQNDSPEENVRFGRDLLTTMLRRYNGNLPLALAAYNAGPAVADRFYQGRADANSVQRPAQDKQRPAPAGYDWGTDEAGQIILRPIPGGPADRKSNPTPADQAKSEQAHRKELSDRLKEPRQVLTMFTNLQKAAQSPTAANDLSLIFAYMKMLDPGSVVREQEFANAQNAAGVPDQVRNMFNRLQNGERLNPNQRAHFVAAANQVAQTARDQITATTREYQDIAEQYGWDTQRATGMADFRDVQSGGPGRSAAPASSYRVGQDVTVGGQRYRVSAINPNDPEDVDLEPIP